MANIFISYRRDDSLATAGRIRDRLVQAFGRNRVFVDVDDIPHGQDFVKVLQGKVAECSVLLAIIGPRWLDARDNAGARRLDDPEDFVGIEISSALARDDIAVIPVLVDGARMPTPAELPVKLKMLSRRNAIELRNTQFGSDADRLIRSIEAAIGGAPFAWRKTAAALVALAVAAGGAWYYWTHHDAPATEQSATTRPAVKDGPLAKTHSTGVIAPKLAGPPDAKADVAAAIGRLREILGPAEGRVSVGFKGGNRVRIGDQVIFEVASRTPGRLVLIDLNAKGEVTQIFPNSFLPAELVARVPAGTISVPGPGYGFSGFKAVEPAGHGRLLALVQPDAVPADRLAMVREQIDKGFEPVNQPGAYLDQLVRHVTASVGERSPGKAAAADWGFALVDYEIVR